MVRTRSHPPRREELGKNENGQSACRLSQAFSLSIFLGDRSPRAAPEYRLALG
jgi:hypothetical protein